jgi:DNA polymerase III delta prime subunit
MLFQCRGASARLIDTSSMPAGESRMPLIFSQVAVPTGVTSQQTIEFGSEPAFGGPPGVKNCLTALHTTKKIAPKN